MKFFAAIFILIITNNSLFSQDKLSITFEYAPNYSYRIYRLTDCSPDKSPYISGKDMYDGFIKLSNETEKIDLGYLVQIGTTLKLNDKFYLFGGLGYRKLNEFLKIKYSIPYNYSGQEYYVYTYHEYVNKIEYIYIPLKLIYNLKTMNRTSINSSFGFGTNYLLNENLKKASHGYIYYSKDNELDVKKIAIDLRLGFIFDYQLSNRFGFYIQPDFSIFLTPNVKYKLVDTYNNHCSISQNNYSADLIFGLRINI